MQNWSNEEKEAMQGYIILAAKLLNGDNRAEYGTNLISNDDLAALLKYLHRATDELTTDEARAYYLKNDNF